MMKNNKLLRFGHIVLLVVLVLTNILIIRPNKTYADTPTQAPSKQEYLDARWIGELTTCMSSGTGGAVNKDVSSSDYNNFNNIMDSGEIPGVNVGHDLDKEDGYLRCDDVAKKAKASVKKIFGSYTAYLDLFYKDKEGGGKTARDNLTQIALDLNAGPFLIQVQQGEIRQARFAVAFSRCFDEANGSAHDIDIDGGKYVYYPSGTTGNTTITIGDISNPTSTDVNPPQIRCSVIASESDSLNIRDLFEKLSLNTGKLRTNPQIIYTAIASGAQADDRTAEARAAILAKLEAADPNVIIYCLGKAGLPLTIPIDRITEWLISGDNFDLNWQTGPQNSQSATDEQAGALLSCLMDAIDGLKATVETYREDLQEILDEYEATEAAGAEDAPEDDKCLASNDFVSWFVCPVLDFVDLILDELAEAIQDWLRFDLDQMNTGTNGGGMYTAWNVFRSLATILIMAGFLLALLVKGIKGE